MDLKTLKNGRAIIADNGHQHGCDPVRRCISLIVPCWRNDPAHLENLLKWSRFPGVHEVILAAAPDSSISTEHQPDMFHFVEAQETGRGPQFNAGAAVATGDILLFQHLDTDLTDLHTAALAEKAPESGWSWGAFHRKFDERHPELRFLERPERFHARTFGTLYGDQSIFVRRSAFQEAGGFAPIPLMEDVEFSQRMRRRGSPLLLDPPIASSPRRHQEQGPWKTTMKNMLMLIRYRLGACPRKLHAEYYRKRACAAAPLSVIAALAVLVGIAAPLPASEPWEADYAALLKSYVSTEGIRYEAWHNNKNDVEKLSAITRQIAKTGPSSTSREASLAYHINAYNIWMLHEVLQHYPIKSVRDIAPIFGVFTGRRIEVAGEKMSLNHLEKQILLKDLAEPRVHFAVNCASISCPPLLSEPFTAAKVQEQLETVSHAFLSEAGPHSYLPDKDGKSLRVSSLFDWYQADFDPPGTIAFINRYRSSPLSDNLKISFLEYDWNLNSRR